MEPILLEIPHAWSDDELYDFCIANRNLFIERNQEGQIIIMAPAGGISSSASGEITADLIYWNRKTKSGKVFDSSGGFLLPNGAMRSPDAAWIKAERWESLSAAQQQKFLPFCPEFVVEVRSPSDSLNVLQAKMQEWLDNGCELAWLIDPSEQKVYIYHTDGTSKLIDNFNQIISGGELLRGFEFDLKLLLN